MRIACTVIFSISIASSSFSADGDATPAAPPVPTFDKTDATAYGRAVADYADLFDSGWKDEYGRNAMTLFDATGDSVRRDSVRIILEKEEGDKSIIRFVAPAEIKAVAALTHEHPAAVDDNWLYLPSSKRVRRISGANKTASFQGTEFTYEDLSNLIVAKYAWKFLGEAEREVDGKKESVLRLEAKPKYRDTGYSRLVVSINPVKWRRESIEFYDKAGRKLKTLTNRKWKLLHGRFWRPYQIEMKNEQTKKRTVIHVGQLLLDLSRYKSSRTGKSRANLTDRQFTTRALEGR